jgi:hypothetical protein
MEFEDNGTQKVDWGLLLGARLAFFALENQFVLSSFFVAFADSKGLIEFVPSILVSFSVFSMHFPHRRVDFQPPSRAGLHSH